jgi:hypothetical protein
LRGSVALLISSEAFLYFSAASFTNSASEASFQALLTVDPTFSACFPIVSEACLKVSEPTP